MSGSGSPAKAGAAPVVSGDGWARWLYSAALRLLTPLYFLRLWGRGRAEPRYRTRFAQRLGYYRGSVPPGLTLWLHAVSLGETRAAATLVEALRAHRPGLRLLLTCSTATGWESGKHLLRAGDFHAWLPYDTPGAVRRFYRHFQPALGVVMETEVWPNLLHQASRRKIPMVLANARLSEKSLAKGRRTARLLRPAVQRFTRILAQTMADAQRLRDFGAESVQVCGNLKFDMTPSPKVLARGLQWRQAQQRPVVLAASTREGEEGPLVAAWAARPEPRPLLVVVPRHPQRFDEVAALIASSALSMVRRSRWTDTPPHDATEVDVWLGDSMGEMPLYYGLSDVALLGGSFAPLGGQNLIEAAACGCPVVMGPHTFNFADAAQLCLDARAGVRVADIAEGVARASALAADPHRNVWVQHALTFAAAHRGATERMAQRIVALLPG